MPCLRLLLNRWCLAGGRSAGGVSGVRELSGIMPGARTTISIDSSSPHLAIFTRHFHDDNNDNNNHEPIFPGEFWHQFEGDDETSSNDKKYVNILHLNAAHSYESLVSTASRQLTDQLRIPFRLKEVDLFQELDHYDSEYARAKLRMLQGRGTAEDEMKFEPVLAMAKEINLVDVLLISTPMWNYSVPYVLKQYIDIVIQPGINFKEKRGETPKAVRPGRPLLLITSAGGAASPERDFLGPYLKLIFSLVGFDRVCHVNMSGASKATREQILGEKAAEIGKMAQFLENYSTEFESTNS